MITFTYLLSGFIGSILGSIITILLYLDKEKKDIRNTAKIVYFQLYNGFERIIESLELNSDNIMFKESDIQKIPIYITKEWDKYIVKLSPYLTKDELIDLFMAYELISNIKDNFDNEEKLFKTFKHEYYVKRYLIDLMEVTKEIKDLKYNKLLTKIEKIAKLNKNIYINIIKLILGILICLLIILIVIA
ncbi:hypothetical protein SAMN02745135_01156 [Caloranaerobacter azorensis DSM 13643]|uniref:Uncharacterized protein n=1 Tax=Caloranaerobacter azorensis DSM 13643 TaxID=1121264 RepID=A0A1M5TVJ2_9FIRM|nr:hypothetical protein [Caloranaerobacter azorensis]SHH54681.1 hypothetical protein SAMN02745135_01156 [Caloranaerobacter azorensis DSM 13643]